MTSRFWKGFCYIFIFVCFFHVDLVQTIVFSIFFPYAHYLMFWAMGWFSYW